MHRLLVVLTAAAALSASDSGWLPLFDGKTLSGWKATGAAEWRVEEGAIVGRQGRNGAPGDLFSEARWKDFEVDAEWRMTFPGNSGLWFRWAGPNTGCQADFLENEPAFPGILSGSVYCMGQQFVGVNRDPATIHKKGWNRLHMRVTGEAITVVLNGREVVRTRTSSQPRPGSIGLQVHAGKQFEGMEVRVRNLRLRPVAGGGQ
jgi:hypothetical protein